MFPGNTVKKPMPLARDTIDDLRAAAQRLSGS